MKNNRFGQAKVLDTSELDLVIKYLPSKFHQVLANTLRNTGARVGEVIQLTWNDVEEESILFPKTICKRKLKSREIFISKTFYKSLMDWKEDWALYKGRKPLPEDYIFYGRFNGSHITSRSFMYAHEEALERAEITKATTHSYRRTQLSQLHKKGVPLRVVQKLSGHRSLDTLQRYLEVSDEDKREAVKHLV